MSEPRSTVGSLEPVTRPLAGWRKFRADIGPLYAANGLIGFIFAATGPVAEGAGALAQAVSAARTGTSSQVRRVRVMAGRGSAEP